MRAGLPVLGSRPQPCTQTHALIVAVLPLLLTNVGVNGSGPGYFWPRSSLMYTARIALARGVMRASHGL